MNYFFKKNNTTLGPIPLADLLKIIDANTEISEDGTEWALAKDIPALAIALGLGKPIGPPPLPTSKPTPPPVPPAPPSMPRQRVMPPLQSPQFEKSNGLSLRTVLVAIAIVGLLIFAGIAYMDGPGNSSPYSPSRSNNLDDYNQDKKRSNTRKNQKESATPSDNYRKTEEESKPQKVQCITCNGTSKVEGKCTSCMGSGRDFGLDCNICEGSGLRPVACKSCDGDGWVND